MSGRLEGKVAIVTGAASGIGVGVATRFAAEGAIVYGLDRDAAALQTALGAGPVRGLVADITDEGSVAAAIGRVIAEQGRLDAGVANAGVQLFGEDAAIADLDLAVWQRTVDVNLTGTFLTLKHVIRAMLPTGGSVIVTGSPTGVTGEGRGFAAYSATKAGDHQLARTAAADYAHAGIRVNVVVPGFTATPLVSSFTDDPEARAQILSRVPLGRAGTAEDVAGLMVYLASDEASFATGSMYFIDGGMTSL